MQPIQTQLRTGWKRMTETRWITTRWIAARDGSRPEDDCGLRWMTRDGSHPEMDHGMVWIATRYGWMTGDGGPEADDRR